MVSLVTPPPVSTTVGIFSSILGAGALIISSNGEENIDTSFVKNIVLDPSKFYNTGSSNVIHVNLKQYNIKVYNDDIYININNFYDNAQLGKWLKYAELDLTHLFVKLNFSN